MASSIHQPQQRAKAQEFRPIGQGVSDRGAWQRMSHAERAAWMRRRQELKRLLKGKRTKG